MLQDNLNLNMIPAVFNSADEILKVKELLIRNAITNFNNERLIRNYIFTAALILALLALWVNGVVVIFILTLVYCHYKNLKIEGLEKQIQNAMSIWGNDLGDKKDELSALLHDNVFWF